MARATDLPDPKAYEWDFETGDGVGIWYMNGWQGYADEDLDAASDHYRERGREDDITATLAVFGDETRLPRETQEYMSDAWSTNGEYTGADRIGFVAEGITAMAVASRIDVPGAEVESFTDLDEALEWARA